MPAITIPNLGQPGAGGIPLPVQQAPAGQPMLTPPTTGGSPAMTGNGTPGVSPLYQQFMDSAGQAGQLAQNWQTSQTSDNGSNGGKVGLFGSGLASLVASAKATGPLIAATWDVLTGNTEGANAHAANAQKDLTDPVLGYKPLSAMNNEEALGTAGEAVAIGAAPVAPVLSGAAFGASNAMQNNEGVGGVAGEAALGAIGGKVADMAAPYLGKVAGAAADLLPQGIKDAVGGAVSKLVDTATPLLDKIVPDAATSGALKDAVETYAPNVSKLFMSSAEPATQSAFSDWTAGQAKITGLGKTLGQEMDDLSGALTEQFPEAKITLNASQVEAIQTAAQKAGISLPKFMTTASEASVAGEDVTAELGQKVPAIDLNISQAQQLGTSLNQAYEKGYIENVYGDLRQTIRTQLNESHPGLGTVYDQMYETASTGYRAIESLDNIFNAKPGKTLDSTNIKNYISTIQDQLNDPTQKPILQNILSKFKTATGVDLSGETQAVASAANIKDPLARRAAKAVVSMLKKNGVLGTAIGAYEVLKHGL